MIFGHLDPKLTKSDGTDDVESNVKWQNSNQDKEDGVETQFPVKESRTEENTRNSHVPGWESAKKQPRNKENSLNVVNCIWVDGHGGISPPSRGIHIPHPHKVEQFSCSCHIYT